MSATRGIARNCWRWASSLYELRSEQAEPGQRLRLLGRGSNVGGESRSMLHSKVLVVDGRLLVVGSMNLDLRSQLQNTEIALLIRSNELSPRRRTTRSRPRCANGAWRVETRRRRAWSGARPQDSELKTPPPSPTPARPAPVAEAVRPARAGPAALSHSDLRPHPREHLPEGRVLRGGEVDRASGCSAAAGHGTASPARAGSPRRACAGSAHRCRRRCRPSRTGPPAPRPACSRPPAPA